MIFESPLVKGTIISRYKRFLADVILEENYENYKKGELITVHTANTGSMKTCWEKGWPVYLSYHDSPKRKLKFSLEMTFNGHTWIGVNTQIPNKLVEQTIRSGSIIELTKFENIKSEVKVGESRIDLLLFDGQLSEEKNLCYIEIKNVSMLGPNKTAIFPDAITERGQKHLHELMTVKKKGHRACMFYLIQREDIQSFSPAFSIDPVYSQILFEATLQGVEVLAYQCEVSPQKIEITRRVPLVFLK